MQYPSSFDDGRPSFDHEVARQLVGKRVLIGVTAAVSLPTSDPDPTRPSVSDRSREPRPRITYRRQQGQVIN